MKPAGAVAMSTESASDARTMRWMILPPKPFMTTILSEARVEGIESQIDDDACYGDVHPHRPGELGELAVLLPARLVREPEDPEDHGQVHDREDDVADEEGEVGRAHPPCTAEAKMAELWNHDEVVPEVARQEDRAHPEGGAHQVRVTIARGLVAAGAGPADDDPAREEEQGGEAV